MTEIREDPLSGRKVIVAYERSKRPHVPALKIAEEVTEEDLGQCPFCEGKENDTPPEVYTYSKKGRHPDTPGWKVRVVPNKYPAFQKEDGKVVEEGLFKHRPAIGVHEVIIHSTDHYKNFGELSDDQIGFVLQTMRHRMFELCQIPGIEHVSIIVNHKPEAGASISHPHSQILAAPIVPPAIEKETTNFDNYSKSTYGKCLLCSVIEEEKKISERVFLETEKFITIAPYASRLPYELLVAPKTHLGHLWHSTDDEMNDLAQVFSKIFSTYFNKLNNPPYNLLLHSAPCSGNNVYHWHMEVIPRITLIAGFELASGMMINIISPEQAVTFLLNDKVV